VVALRTHGLALPPPQDARGVVVDPAVFARLLEKFVEAVCRGGGPQVDQAGEQI